MAANERGIVICREKRTGMQGFHCLKRGMYLESGEEVRKCLQLQQLQWIEKSEPHTPIHRGSNYTSMTTANECMMNIINMKCATTIHTHT